MHPERQIKIEWCFLAFFITYDVAKSQKLIFDPTDVI